MADPVLTPTDPAVALSARLQAVESELANAKAQAAAAEQREAALAVQAAIGNALSGKSLRPDTLSQVTLLLEKELTCSREDGKLVVRGADYSDAAAFLQKTLSQANWSHFFDPTRAAPPKAAPAGLPYQDVPESKLSLGQRVVLQHIADSAEKRATQPQLPPSLDMSAAFGLPTRRR
jgi:hypothetical protein